MKLYEQDVCMYVLKKMPYHKTIFLIIDITNKNFLISEKFQQKFQ